MTPQHWLGTYLQLTNMEETKCGELVRALFGCSVGLRLKNGYFC